MKLVSKSLLLVVKPDWSHRQGENSAASLRQCDDEHLTGSDPGSNLPHMSGISIPTWKSVEQEELRPESEGLKVKRVLLDDQYIFQLHLFLHLNLHIIRPTDLQRRLERQQDNIYIWSLSFLENNVKAAASLHILGKRTKWWANQNHCVVVAAFLWKWMTWDEMSLLLNLQSILGSEVPQRLIRRAGKQPQVTVLLRDTDRRHRVVILCFIIKIYNYKLV